jgi:LacI family transcriptional regulator
MSTSKSGLPTIVDVAEAAGVSRATASRALSNYGRINADTKQAVIQAAAKLGYRPNAVAQAMRRGSTKTIGLVIVADFTNAFFDRATKAIIDSARLHDYQVLVSHTDEEITAERAAVDTLLDKQVDGLIVVPSTVAVHDHLSPSHLNGRPVILIDRRLDGVRLTSVTTNDFLGCDSAVRHAFSLGHKRFAFLIAAPNLKGFSADRPSMLISSVEDRVNGFQNATIDLGSKVKSQWIFCEDRPAVSEAAVMALLDSPKPPSVILTSNNDMALAVLKVAGNRKLAMGKDISLITVDDSIWAEASVPGLTVVARPVEELGAIAVTKLLAEIQSGTKPGEKIILPTELISRGSVANLKMYPELDPGYKGER